MMRQGIAPVLVVEYDEGVRIVLHDLLTNVGYEVIEHATDAAALDFLAANPDGVVVVYGNQDADHHLSAAFFARVVAGKRIASRHRYLLLSTNPALIPPALEAHLIQLNAVVLPKPFDLETVVICVHEAAGRLAPGDAPRRATG